MYAQGPINEYQRQQQALINRNYWSVYKHLLPDEREKILCKQPIEIGDKDVYALSDIEGNNLNFLSFLQKLGLVEIGFRDPKVQACPESIQEWKCCHASDNPNGQYVYYYKFNKKNCKNFSDVIVLCGDYIGHNETNEEKCSQTTLDILKELNNQLNQEGRATDENKKLFLIAGNHDIFTYYEPNLTRFKEQVLSLGLYPQLLLRNAERKKLLFQHTNFPYREDKNYIVNKQIDLGKAKWLLKNPMSQGNLPMYEVNSFFHLRYTAPEGAKQPNYGALGTAEDPESKPLQREIYSDLGIGYDAKFIGHDAEFYGCSMRPDGKGDVYNVHIANQNDPHFVCWRSNRKTSLPLSNVQPNDKKIGNIYNCYAIQDKEGKKNLYNLLYNKLPKANPPKYY